MAETVGFTGGGDVDEGLGHVWGKAVALLRYQRNQ